MATPPQPTPEQIAMMQQQFAAEAAKRGMTPQQYQAHQRKELEEQAKKAGLSVEQYVNKIRQQAFENHMRQQQMAQQQGSTTGEASQPQGPQGQQVPITPGAADPKAEALAKWLRSQDLKTRTCLLNGQRKDMFRGMPTISFTFTRQPAFELTNPIIKTSQTGPPCPPIARL